MHSDHLRRATGLVALLGLVATPAFAHPGHDSASFMTGVLHPLSGLDHMAVMVAVGWVALGSRDDQARLALPLGFLAAMAMGAWTLGTLGAGLAEAGVMGSLLVAAALLLGHRQVPLLGTGAAVALAGLAHGAVHGIEAGGGSLPFIAGMLVSSGGLLATGMVLAAGLARLPRPINIGAHSVAVAGLIGLFGLAVAG